MPFHIPNQGAVLLDEAMSGEVLRGQIIATPGSSSAHTTFDAEIYWLNEDEGAPNGLVTPETPLQFFFRTIDVPGTVDVLAGAPLGKLGGWSSVSVDLSFPMALQRGLRFAIRATGRTVGAGSVAEVKHL